MVIKMFQFTMYFFRLRLALLPDTDSLFVCVHLKLPVLFRLLHSLVSSIT